jgi:predicted DNA-binding ribbon-helix-helix protein
VKPHTKFGTEANILTKEKRRRHTPSFGTAFLHATFGLLTFRQIRPTLACDKGGPAMCQMFAGQSQARYESVTRRLRLNGQSTSIRLERAFWGILDEIAAKEGVSTPAFLSKLHSEVLQQHGEASNFTSLLRCACTIHLGELDQVPQMASRFAAE